MIDTEKPHTGHDVRGATPVLASQSTNELAALANELARTGRWTEGIPANQEIVEREPGNREAWIRLGRCYSRSGDQNAAIRSYREALTIEAHPALHIELGVLFMDAGDGESAASEFQNAINLNPSDAVALSNLGTALRLIGKPREAQQAFEQSLAIDPSNAMAHGNLGNLFRDRGETDAAIRSLKECIRLEPGRPESYAFLAGASLEAGHPDEALSAIEQALRLDPINRTAFAYKSAALQEAGDMHSARHLLDLENLIDVKKFEVVPGYSSLREFNDKLAAHVLQHPTLSYERTGNATRFGSHTGNLLLGSESLTVDFERLINERVREYFASREARPDHPFMAHRMTSWSSVAWAVVMREGGHQIPHIHASAWLSGVYYAKVPASVRADSSSREGWIEFGSPPESLQCKRQQLQRFLFPEEGKMILFPSYFYHKTIPLKSGEERISIAFDVSPGRPAQQNL